MKEDRVIQNRLVLYKDALECVCISEFFYYADVFSYSFFALNILFGAFFWR
ncbi:hypothetical protein HMPREF9554_02904 [Treponema phagedenis F0421]|nr:hypothetical protein HMPREF9554_02904 [Treponema phagedenis F0421]